MDHNPDVELILYGYSTDDESQNVALSRANSIKQALSKIHPEIENRITISEKHDVYQKRAQREQFEGTRLGEKYTADENRRVELGVQIQTDRFEFTENQLPDDELLRTISDFLIKNPEMFLAVRAKDIPTALQYKLKLLQSLGGEFSERIFSQDGTNEGIELVLSASGLIYRPPQVIQPKEGYRIEPEWDLTTLAISSKSEAPIVQDDIYVIQERDTLVHSEKDTAQWDWDLSKGKAYPPGTQFKAIGIVKDSLEQTAETEPQKLSVIVKNINEVQQRLILLQFVFAGEQSESEFSNARMEFIANKVIERIEAGDVNVIITGHTDTIGTFSRNDELSLNRAEEQMTILRKYLRSLLGKNDDELNSWITGHNATLQAEGFGMKQRFTILRLQDNEEIPIVVGDNTLPEGRIKNRRVEILFVPKRER